MESSTAILARKGCLAASLISLLFLFAEISFAQVIWTKHGSAVLSPGASGEWDDQLVAPGTVIFQDTVYKMWYSGFDGTYMRIGYATSPNGINWTKHNGPVLDLGPSGSWEDNYAGLPFVHFDGSTYRMWYTGDDGTYERGGYATSADGVNWTKYSGNPVMNLGASGKWDDFCVTPGPVVFDTAFHMIYNGFADGNTSRGGYAASPDGMNWTKSSDPVIDLGSWDTPRVQVNSIIYDSSKSRYVAYYGGGDIFGWRIGYATAAKMSGPWTKFGSKILDVTAGAWDNRYVGWPCVLYDSTNKQYKMWYMGGSTAWTGSIGYATAQDPLEVPAEFSTIQEAIDAAADRDVVLVSEGTYFENIRFRGKKIAVASQFMVDGDTSHISKTVIDGSHSTDPDSGSTVYFVSGEDTNSVLCGFTITGGTGTNTKQGFYATNDRMGGGIYATSGARISHNIIAYNTIDQATANGAYGGGIACRGFAIIEDNIISRNVVQSQSFQTGCGGIVIMGSCTRLVNNLISNNIAQTSATNWNSNGGGVGVAMADSVLIYGNLITHNNGVAPNCTVYPCWGGGLHTYNSNSVKVLNNRFVENLSQGNDGSNGGGISLYNGSNHIVQNNILAGNTASSGGGISWYTDAFVTQSPSFVNNTIVSNLASSGQAGGIRVSSSSYPVVLNTIVWGNGGGPEISGTATVQYCDIEGGYTGTGNLNADPAFVVGDTMFNLSSASWCIGRGADSIRIASYWVYAPKFDFDGHPRPRPLHPPQGPDIGAQEEQTVTDVTERHPETPVRFALAQNYPNPFNPTTTISYELSANSFVSLKVYDVLGREVKTLVNEVKRIGRYEVRFDASGLASGVYFYRLVVGNQLITKKMLLMK